MFHKIQTTSAGGLMASLFQYCLQPRGDRLEKSNLSHTESDLTDFLTAAEHLMTWVRTLDHTFP